MHAGYRKRGAIAATLIIQVAISAACSGEEVRYESVKVEGLDEVRGLMNDQDYEAAAIHARKILSKVRETRGQNSLEASLAVDALMESLLRLGRTIEPEDRELAKRAAAIKERILGADHIGVAESLDKLGRLHLQNGYGGKAKATLQRALAITKRHLGERNLRVAEILTDLGNAHVALGEYPSAGPLYREALEITMEISGEEHPDVTPKMYNLARFYRRNGDFDAALPILHQVLDIIEKNNGYKHPWYVLALNGLAILLEQTGDYSGARVQYERALGIAREVHGSEHPAVADALNNLGLLYRKIGDYESARSSYKQALEIDQKTRPRHPYTAATKSNIGELHYLVGEYDAARALYEEALELRRETLPIDNDEIGESLLALGTLLLKEKDLAKAGRYFEDALRILEANFGRTHPDCARCLGGLGQVSEQMGDLATAAEHYREAAAILEQSLGPEHPDTAAGLLDIGRVFARTRDVKTALDNLLRAETISRNHLRLTSYSLAESEALGYASVRTSGLDMALSLAAQGLDPQSRRMVWDAVVRSRAVVFDEMAARHRTLAGSSDAEIARIADEFVSASRRLANLMVRGPDVGRLQAFRSQIEHAQQARDTAERALAERNLTFRQDKLKMRAGLSTVSEFLPAGSALVAYVRYDRANIDELTPGSSVPSYLAFVLNRRDGEPEVVPLGSSVEIDRLISRWKSGVAQHSARGTRPYLIAAEKLRRRVWDPIIPKLQNAERIFLVPDGALHNLNLYTLPVEGGFLIEDGPAIHYLSTERDVVFPEKEITRGEGLLAIGGVNFNKSTSPAMSSGNFRGKRSGCADFRSIVFEPLPASARESMEVVDMWRGATTRLEEEPRHGGPVIHLMGEKASEAAFKENAPGRRVLHLATHGFFLGGRCVSAIETTRAIGGLEPRSPDSENPLLLSGLALAGANRRDGASPDEEDGILTAEEIVAMDLSGVEWAVLSACDSGLGEFKAGEGVFGLRRALQTAGVRTLIMSLWPVGDQTAREWMGFFYQNRLLRGMGTIDAVRAASLELLRRRRANGQIDHPAHWAPFVAVGHSS